MKAPLRESLSMPGVCCLWSCVQAGDTGKDMLRKNLGLWNFWNFLRAVSSPLLVLALPQIDIKGTPACPISSSAPGHPPEAPSASWHPLRS